MKKFFILIAICFCICLLVIPALAAEDTDGWESDAYNVSNDVDVYQIDDDTIVTGLPCPPPVEPEPIPAPMPRPIPAPMPRPVPEPIPEPIPVPDPEPNEPDPERVPPPFCEEKPVGVPKPDKPAQESLEDTLGLDEIFRIPEEEYEIIIEQERIIIGVPAFQSEPQWAFCSEILSRGRLAPADVQLALESSGEVRVVKLGSKLYFPGLKPGYKVILVDLTSMKITQIVDKPIFIDKPAGKTLAILVDENLVFLGRTIVG